MHNAAQNRYDLVMITGDEGDPYQHPLSDYPTKLLEILAGSNQASGITSGLPVMRKLSIAISSSCWSPHQGCSSAPKLKAVGSR
jgi:hypothetical protein